MNCLPRYADSSSVLILRATGGEGDQDAHSVITWTFVRKTKWPEMLHTRSVIRSLWNSFRTHSFPNAGGMVVSHHTLSADTPYLSQGLGVQARSASRTQSTGPGVSRQTHISKFSQKQVSVGQIPTDTKCQ